MVFNKINSLALLCIMLSFGCKQAQHAGGVVVRPVAAQASEFLNVVIRQYDCPAEAECQIGNEWFMSYQLSPDKGDKEAAGLALLTNDAAIELVNYNLIMTKPNIDGRMIDLYEKTFLSEGCYPYIHDKVADLLYLDPSKSSFPAELQSQHLNMASYGLLCLNPQGQLAAIAVLAGDADALKNFLTDTLPLAPESLALGSVARNWDTAVTTRVDYADNLKRYDAFETSVKPSALGALFGKKTTLADINAKSSLLRDDELASLYEISSIRKNALVNSSLETEIFRRFEQKKIKFADSVGAFTDDGVKQLVVDFKSIYPRLKDTNIEVINTADLRVTIPNLPEGKHAFIANITGDAHRTLVYVNNTGGKKYIFVSDSVGLSNPKYHAEYTSLAKDMEGQGYTFATDVRRQADSINCSVFCLKDIASLDKHPNLLAKLQDTVTLKAGKLNTAPIVPAELLVTAQSVSLLKKNHEIGSFFDNAAASGRPVDMAKAEFSDHFLVPAQAKFDAAKDAGSRMQALEDVNFYESYVKKFDDIYGSKDLQNLYFRRAAAEGQPAVKLGDYIDANAQTVGSRQVNAEITKLRTMLVSQAYRSRIVVPAQ